MLNNAFEHMCSFKVYNTIILHELIIQEKVYVIYATVFAIVEHDK